MPRAELDAAVASLIMANPDAAAMWDIIVSRSGGTAAVSNEMMQGFVDTWDDLDFVAESLDPGGYDLIDVEHDDAS